MQNSGQFAVTASAVELLRGARWAAVFPTSTKDSSVISLDDLAAICAAVSIPVVAIGGVSVSKAASVVEAGAAGAAVVSAVFGTGDPAVATAQIRQVRYDHARRAAS